MFLFSYSFTVLYSGLLLATVGHPSSCCSYWLFVEFFALKRSMQPIIKCCRGNQLSLWTIAKLGGYIGTPNPLNRLIRSLMWSAISPRVPKSKTIAPLDVFRRIAEIVLSRRFLPRDAMLARYMPSSSSVCLSQVSVLPKWLNLRSRRQQHTIAQGL